MKLFGFFAFLGVLLTSSHAQTASAPWDDHCIITAPEGGYAELRYGQPWLNPETLETGLTYTYQTGIQEICGLDEICYTNVQEHSTTLRFEYDETWQGFLEQRKDWFGFYDVYLSVGLELIPGYDEPTDESGQEDSHFGESSYAGPYGDGTVVRFTGTYNICENLRLQLVTTTNEGLCSGGGACDGYAKSTVDVSYLGEGLFRLVPAYETAAKGLEGQERCAAMTGNSDGKSLAIALCAIGLLALVSVRRVFA